MRFLARIVAVITLLLAGHSPVAPALAAPRVVAFAEHDALSSLAPKLARLANRAPGMVAISVLDLNHGYTVSINGDVNLPAASTIKIPVMVEVMRQIALHRFTFER
ncbi:MAG: serine hydrolase, partial [Candidatus Eremiobacteraeota bacterium]|nr:serine hydrolase [Candidatus Eremiobacteraeota bacterium]